MKNYADLGGFYPPRPSASVNNNPPRSAYSLTSPYGHLCIYGNVRLVPEMQKSYIPYLYNTDTCVKRTFGYVPLVSELKRLDCNSSHPTKAEFSNC